jgi:hypothetical protein
LKEWINPDFSDKGQIRFTTSLDCLSGTNGLRRSREGKAERAAKETMRETKKADKAAKKAIRAIARNICLLLTPFYL